MSITVLLNRPVSCFYKAFASKTFLLLDKTNVFDKPRAEGKSRSVCTMPRRENVCCEETNVFNKPRAEGKSRSVCTMPRRENVCCEETNVFDKPRAEGKSRSVCTMPRRENVCCEETKLFNWVLLTSQYFESNLWVHFKKFSSILFLQKKQLNINCLF